MAYPSNVQPPGVPAPPGYTMPAAPGQPGFLSNDGSGNLSWVPAGGGSGNLPISPGPDLVLHTDSSPPFNPMWTNILSGGVF
jgi:hypothetical protein